MSLLTGVYPDLLKLVKVIPIHKGSSTQDVNNYRPISLLSIFDKIIEKLMHNRLYTFLEHHNILFHNQFGFRKNNSTVHTLVQITEMIKVSIDSGKFGCGIFIDLIKAFDTVNHEILLTKLEHYGIRGNIGSSLIKVTENNMSQLMVNHHYLLILVVVYPKPVAKAGPGGVCPPPNPPPPPPHPPSH